MSLLMSITSVASAASLGGAFHNPQEIVNPILSESQEKHLNIVSAGRHPSFFKYTAQVGGT